jgi:uncharacterized protein (DUF1501 family)
MLTVLGERQGPYCDGMSRRNFLRVGSLASGALSLSELLRLRAAGQTDLPRKSIIMICLGGGPSHLDMYDMRPGAPAEYRGELSPIRTNVSGMELCELMPRQAHLADRLAVVRSMQWTEPTITIPNASGRPMYLLDDCEPIAELL